MFHFCPFRICRKFSKFRGKKTVIQVFLGLSDILFDQEEERFFVALLMLFSSNFMTFPTWKGWFFALISLTCVSVKGVKLYRTFAALWGVALLLERESWEAKVPSAQVTGSSVFVTICLIIREKWPTINYCGECRHLLNVIFLSSSFRQFWQ